MGVYNDLLYPCPFGSDEEKKTDSKIINEILKQIKELQGKITELEKAMASLEKDTSRAKQEAEQALAIAQLALSNMQAMLAQIEAINNKATQADNKATQALNSINDIRTEISIIARVADNAIDKATEAINKANEAQQTAEQADSKADEAIETANQAYAKADISGAFLATYDQTTYADVVAAIDANKPIIVDFANNHNLLTVTYSTYGAVGSDVLMYAIYKSGNNVTLATITVTSESAWSITHTEMQDKLVSGTSIKTINNTSLLGYGNIAVPTQEEIDTQLADYMLKTDLQALTDSEIETIFNSVF